MIFLKTDHVPVFQVAQQTTPKPNIYMPSPHGKTFSIHRVKKAFSIHDQNWV
jgi:hypothetical protein